MNISVKTALSGLAAGAVNGLFGAGGGMILVPLLTKNPEFSEEEVFPSSVSIIAPLCVVSLFTGGGLSAESFRQALPYLLGAAAGGLAAALSANRLPVKWLHRILGGMIIMGGIRNLC